MKTDFSNWVLISNSNRNTSGKTKANGIRITLQKDKKGNHYAAFAMSGTIAMRAGIAIGDRISVSRSPEGTRILIAKNENGTHKLTCTGSLKKQGKFCHGNFKWTITNNSDWELLDFRNRTDGYEMEILEVGEGYVIGQAGRPGQKSCDTRMQIKKKGFLDKCQNVK